MKKLIILFLLAAQVARAQDKGTVRTDTIVSAVLGYSVTHENRKRAVSIYLPPGYATGNKRYPVLYLLHGIGDNNMDFMDDSLKSYGSVEELMDKGIASHRLKPMIIVTPNEKTNFYGSFYTNSASTGNWEDFTVKELVGYMDRNYRTIPKSGSRAIAGHSMGGYGALMLAMKHPDVFSVAYGMNSALIGFVGDFSAGDEQMRKFVEAKTFADFDRLYKNKDYIAVGALTVAQAFSPNPAHPPFYADKPYKEKGGKIVPNPLAYKEWEAHDVVHMAPHYITNLLKLKAIQFDSGTEDAYTFIPVNNRLFSKKLTELHVPHQFEEYNGDHRNRLWGPDGRINKSLLPFISSHLSN